MVDLLVKCYINSGYQSDHSIIGIDLIQNNFDMGKGVFNRRFKFN